MMSLFVFWALKARLISAYHTSRCQTYFPFHDDDGIVFGELKQDWVKRLPKMGEGNGFAGFSNIGINMIQCIATSSGTGVGQNLRSTVLK